MVEVFVGVKLMVVLLLPGLRAGNVVAVVLLLPLVVSMGFRVAVVAVVPDVAAGFLCGPGRLLD